MRRLGGVAGALAVALTVLAAFPGPARASWTVPGHGLPATAAAAVTMPAGVSPTVTGTGTAAARTCIVSWTAPTGTAVPSEGYQITRTSSLLGAGLISAGTCVGVTTALGLQRVVVTTGTTSSFSCTDSALVAVGAVRYTVTPIYRKWIGAASDWSSPTT